MSIGTAPAVGTVRAAATPPFWLSARFRALRRAAAAQRERWALWTPVLFGAGIALYFALTIEPPAWTGWTAVAGLAAAAVPVWRVPSLRLCAIGLVLVAAGFAVAQGRAHAVAAPVLRHDFGPAAVAGLVVSVDRRPEGTRVVLSAPVLAGLDATETPARVRIRLRRGDHVDIGERIRLRARLSPPAAPAMPGAYDFQRHAWFQRLGGVGFAYTHAVITEEGTAAAEPGSFALWLSRTRLAIADRIRAAVPGTAGAVAAALVVGDRSAIPEETIAAMRDSGLAHLLAISGLHIGLVAAILFFGVRLLLAAVEPAALRLPIKKLAAGCAFAGALAYLFMAGATVPTQRAFVMTGIVLVAVLLDRTAISLRLVAWAAMVVLLLQPESLMGPSFQMSFAAVLALVAVYESLRRPWRRLRASGGAGRRVALYLLALALSTLVAGAATGLFALHHFGRISSYGLVANLIAIPIAGFWIMPCAVLACVLMPFGWEALALVPMGWGIEAMLATARGVAAWPGASIALPAMPGWGLALTALGGIWLCLWRGRGRWAGAAGFAAGVAAVALTAPPDILVAGSGKLMAVRGADGRYSLSSGRAERFAARIWLERSGAAAGDVWPSAAAADGGLACDAVGCVWRAPGRDIAFVRDPRAYADDCRPGAVVISTVPARWHCRSAALVIDRFDLWRDGAHALWLGKDGLDVSSVRQARGDRLWARGPPAAGKGKRTARKSATARGDRAVRVSTAASGRPAGPAP